MFADFIADLLIAQIGLHPEAFIDKGLRHFADIIGLRIGDIEHYGLYRSQPGRQLTGIVLDQDADKSLHRTDDGPVQHHRMLFLRMLVDILGAKALGHHEIDLHGTDLPGAADRILHVVFDLRTIESALARQLFPLHACHRQRRAQRRFGTIPHFVGTDALVRAQRNLQTDVLKAEVAVDLHGLPMERRDLGLDLLGCAENMAVVLGERAHAHDAVQCARGFVAMAAAELTVTDRQLAVAVQAGVEHLHMTGAVHRLQRISVLFRLGEKHVLGVVIPVAGLLPQRHI